MDAKNAPQGVTIRRDFTEKAAKVERERLQEAQTPLADRICELRAITREGMTARAHSFALWRGELADYESDALDDRMRRAIVRDLLTGRAVT